MPIFSVDVLILCLHEAGWQGANQKSLCWASAWLAVRENSGEPLTNRNRPFGGGDGNLHWPKMMRLLFFRGGGNYLLVISHGYGKRPFIDDIPIKHAQTCYLPELAMLDCHRVSNVLILSYFMLWTIMNYNLPRWWPWLGSFLILHNILRVDRNPYHHFVVLAEANSSWDDNPAVKHNPFTFVYVCPSSYASFSSHTMTTDTSIIFGPVLGREEFGMNLDLIWKTVWKMLDSRHSWPCSMGLMLIS